MAARLILDAQAVDKNERHAGGWRYQPDSRESDLSVTGWQLLALRAAKDVGCDVPAESIDRAVEYVRRCQVADGGFAYQPEGSTSATRCGTGILALEICGSHQAPEALAAADKVLAQPLSPRDQYFYYGAYYCGVGMFKIDGRHWDETKDPLFDELLGRQTDDGSWLAEQGSEQSTGKVYCTSLAILALAVEYRYLPIYQR
jgi:prenyltransferase beta subunit